MSLEGFFLGSAIVNGKDAIFTFLFENPIIL